MCVYITPHAAGALARTRTRTNARKLTPACPTPTHPRASPWRVRVCLSPCFSVSVSRYPCLRTSIPVSPHLQVPVSPRLCVRGPRHSHLVPVGRHVHRLRGPVRDVTHCCTRTCILVHQIGRRRNPVDAKRAVLGCSISRDSSRLD